MGKVSPRIMCKKSMGVKPRLSKTEIHVNDDIHWNGCLHLLDDNRSYNIILARIDIEDKFVMNLHDHERFKFLFFDLALDIDHSDLQHFGCSALDRHVD